jgi:hypothetical protein
LPVPAATVLDAFTVCVDPAIQVNEVGSVEYVYCTESMVRIVVELASLLIPLVLNVTVSVGVEVNVKLATAELELVSLALIV